MVAFCTNNSDLLPEHKSMHVICVGGGLFKSMYSPSQKLVFLSMHVRGVIVLQVK